MRRNFKKNTEENRGEKARETAENRRPENGPKSKVTGDLGPWSPVTMGAWSPATLEIRVAGFPPKAPFFRSFSSFAMFGLCDFLKI